MMSYNDGSQRKLFARVLIPAETQRTTDSRAVETVMYHTGMYKRSTVSFTQFQRLLLLLLLVQVLQCWTFGYTSLQRSSKMTRRNLTWNMYSESHVTSKSDSPYAQIDHAII